MSVKPISKPLDTDWERVESMTDEEIDTSDIPPLTEEFFKRAKVRMPSGIRLDREVYAWLRHQGGDVSERINVL
jgi:uncharacterized protein (DUF4415 family)